MLHKDKLMEELNNTDCDFITNLVNISGTYNKCIDFIINSLDKHCPYKSKRIQIKIKINRSLVYPLLQFTSFCMTLFYINIIII